MQVRILLDDREVYAATLQPIKQSSTGKSVILAQSSEKTHSPLPAFTKLGWSFSLYGIPQAAKDGGQ